MPSSPCSLPLATSTCNTVAPTVPPSTMRTAPPCSATYMRSSPVRHAIAIGLSSPEATSVSLTLVSRLAGAEFEGTVVAGFVVGLVVVDVAGAPVVVVGDASVFLSSLPQAAKSADATTRQQRVRRMEMQARTRL